MENEEYHHHQKDTHPPHISESNDGEYIIPPEIRKQQMMLALQGTAERYGISSEDLTRDLGPMNRYDLLPVKALAAGLTFNNRHILEMGTYLTELIRRYPYHHDRFYKVIAQADLIERTLNDLSQEYKDIHSITLKDERGDPLHLSFWVQHGIYRVETNGNRCVNSRERSEYQEELTRNLIKHISIDLNGEIEYETGGCSGATLRTKTYLNSEGRGVYKESTWEHENGRDTGFKNSFLFENRGDAYRAYHILMDKARELH